MTKPLIVGLEGEAMTPEERLFITAHRPAGFILFQRNCVSPEQVQRLTADLRSVTGQERLLILIDQEGGRVARLKPPHWRATPPADFFAKIAAKDMTRAKQLTYLNARLIAAELTELGITVDCAPLADIPTQGSHDIIGDRAYGGEPRQVITLAREMARGLLDGGVLPVLKHIPGHGRATADSHEELPEVKASLKELAQTDFAPFKALSDLALGMTAHIRYTAIDAQLPATLSPKAIGIIREEIGFKNILMTDDLSMKALKGDLGDLAKQSLAAGCDLVLHCNGKMEEMTRIAEALEPMEKAAFQQLEQVWKALPKPGKDSPQAIAEQYEALVA